MSYIVHIEMKPISEVPPQDQIPSNSESGISPLAPPPLVLRMLISSSHLIVVLFIAVGNGTAPCKARDDAI